MSDFDVKFKAYEKAMHANNNFGLKGKALGEQYGRYALGLQYDEQKATNKAKGKAQAQWFATEKKNAARAEQALKNAKAAKNGGKFHGVTAEQLEKRLGLGKTTGLSEYYKAMEANNELAEQALKNAKAAKNGGKFYGVTAEQLEKRLGLGKTTGLSEYYKAMEANNKLAEQALKNVREAEKNAKFKGVTSQQLDDFYGIGKESDMTKYFRELESKGNTGFWGKVKNLVKGKGKWALGAALVVAAGYGISQLFSDKKDEPAKPIKPLIPITDDEAPAGEQPAQAPAGQAPAGEQPAQAPAGQAPAGEQPAQAPAGQAPAGEQPAQAPAGEAPAQQPTPVTGTVIGTVGTQPGNTLVLPDGNCYIVKKGDCVWNIAKKYLQAKNKDVEGYRPRNAEIARETARMMEINKLQYDNTREKKNYYVNIYPGDILKIEENVA